MESIALIGGRPPVISRSRRRTRPRPDCIVTRVTRWRYIRKRSVGNLFGPNSFARFCFTVASWNRHAPFPTLLEGVRELDRLAHTDALAGEEDRSLVIAIESETNALPIGEVRKLW